MATLHIAGRNVTGAPTSENAYSLVKQNTWIVLHPRENVKHVDLETYTRKYTTASLILKKWSKLNVHQQENGNKLWYMHSEIYSRGK